MLGAPEKHLETRMEAALEWELASIAYRRRLVFVPLGFGVTCTAVALSAFRAVARTIGCLTLSGTALSEHLVLRVKNGVNAKQRGSKPLYCLICK